MKRFFIFLLFIFISTYSFAQFSLGISAGSLFPAGTKFPYYKEQSINSYKNAGNPVETEFFSGASFSFSARYGIPSENRFVSPLGIQSELSFFTKNGLCYKIDFPEETEEDKKVRSEKHIYRSFEWNVLASYDYSFGLFSLNVLGGINLSFPLKIHYSSDETERTGLTVIKKTSTPVVFGSVLGLSASYNINEHHALSFESRFIMDTMTMNVNDVAIILRRAVTAGAGYRYKF
jgi:hypothetical protein